MVTRRYVRLWTANRLQSPGMRPQVPPCTPPTPCITPHHAHSTLAAHAWPVHLLAPPRHVCRIAPEPHVLHVAPRARSDSIAPTPTASRRRPWRLRPLEGSRISPAGRPEQPQLTAAALRAAGAVTPRYSTHCAVDASSVAAPPAATPTLFDVDLLRFASFGSMCGPLMPGGSTPVARGHTGGIRSHCIARARTARDAVECVTKVRHEQHAQHRIHPFCGGSYYGLGRAEQRTGSGVHLRREEAVVADVLNV
jgi:hypothetical protein